MKNPLSFTVNSSSVDLFVEPHQSLLDTLRDALFLTGTKKGCDEGDCGACTVIMNGRSVTSCMVLAMDAQGEAITTIEGLASGQELHPVQQAFVDHGGIQCGYCTPGLIMNAVALLEENPDPSPEEIRHALGGNLCRCTGYVKVVDAVRAAASALDQKG